MAKSRDVLLAAGLVAAVGLTSCAESASDKSRDNAVSMARMVLAAYKDTHTNQKIDKNYVPGEGESDPMMSLTRYIGNEAYEATVWYSGKFSRGTKPTDIDASLIDRVDLVTSHVEAPDTGDNGNHEANDNPPVIDHYLSIVHEDDGSWSADTSMDGVAGGPAKVSDLHKLLAS